MLDDRRLMGRLFYWLLTLSLLSATLHATPATTTISDVIYRADGTPARGALLISWPAFTTSDALSNRQIVDEVKFRAGLSKVIDGTVECLNASVWAKPGQAASQQ